jgi:rare lipoprotein A
MFGRLSVALASATSILLISSVASAKIAHHHRHPTASVSGAATARSRAAPKTQSGVASVYATQHQSKKTASGERFDEHKLTAASKTLPLNSKAKVTNLKTGRSVDVTITDRGPYAKHRVIDLSPAAAKEVGIDKKEGVARVEVKPDETLQ